MLYSYHWWFLCFHWRISFSELIVIVCFPKVNMLLHFVIDDAWQSLKEPCHYCKMIYFVLVVSLDWGLFKGHFLLRCPHIWLLEFERLSCSFLTFLGELLKALVSQFTAKENNYCFCFRTEGLFVNDAWYNYSTANVIFDRVCSLNATEPLKWHFTLFIISFYRNINSFYRIIMSFYRIIIAIYRNNYSDISTYCLRFIEM